MPALDARRGQVYAAAFQAGQPPRRLLEDAARDPASLADFVESCKKPLVFVGDGAEICYNRYKDVPGVERLPGFLAASRAAGVCLAAMEQARQGNTQSGEQLRPQYLRLSQAERERAEKLAAKPQ